MSLFIVGLIILLIIIIILIVIKVHKISSEKKNKIFKDIQHINLSPKNNIYDTNNSDTNNSDTYSEKFKNIMLGSMSGQGFSIRSEDLPLFVNFYTDNYGTDFNLRAFIQKSKNGLNNSGLMNQTNVTLKGIYTNGLGQKNIGSKINKKVLIFPDIGASKIMAKWDLSSSSYVKTLDAYGTLETKDKWSCRTLQDNWTPIWPPENITGITKYCWQNNVKTIYDTTTNCINNITGLTSITDPNSSNFFIGNYMNQLIEALQSNEYILGSNLFLMNYDFRLIASDDYLTPYLNEFKNFLEKNTKNGPIILLGHGLGSVVISILLNKITDKKLKDNILFISLAGAFGGFPKALRTLLSGDLIIEKELVRNATANFSGLHLLLPSIAIFEDEPLIRYKESVYYAKDIKKLIEEVYGKDTASIYDICSKLSELSLKDPGVRTVLLFGKNIQTETFYNYDLSLINDPVPINPFYDSFGPNQNEFTYNNLTQGYNGLNGDGTVTNRSLYYILNNWKNASYKLYERAEHMKMLSMYEPVHDIITLINDK